MTADRSTPRPAALELRGIVKRFGATQALDGASVRVEQGSIHGLVGENGAGKSTLIKVLAGIHHADSGELRINGQTLAKPGPRQVEALGVRFTHQERLLPASFTVGEALFFGQEIRFGPWVNRRAQQCEAARLLHDYFDLVLPPGALIRELNSAQRQVLQIIRALLAKPKILVFDEPSVSLVKREVDQLLAIIRRLRDDGLTILYISHYLQEIADLCDQVTVLRNGRDVAQVDPRTTSSAEVARLMVNRDVNELYPKPAVELGTAVLEVRGLTIPGACQGINLTVRRGEVLGLTGLVGSGAKELLQSLFGLVRPSAGSIRLDGRDRVLKSPRHAVREGIALVPEERRSHGVAPALSVLENLTLTSLQRFSRVGVLKAHAEAAESDRLIDALAIKAAGHGASVRQLSGGNQQKVALGKWLSRASAVYLLDEPSVGVDIAAKVEIYRLIGRLVEQGAAVLVLSADLPELIGITDRIIVLHRGSIAGEFVARQVDSERLLACATGAVGAPAPASGSAQGARHVAI